MPALLSLCAQIGKTPPSEEEPHGLCLLPKPFTALVPGHARSGQLHGGWRVTSCELLTETTVGLHIDPQASGYGGYLGGP